MFETSVVAPDPRTLRQARLIILPLSIALHAAAIVAALFVATWSVSLPAMTPSQIQAYMLEVPVVPAPPPPKGDDGSQRPAPRTEVAPQPPREAFAPVEVLPEPLEPSDAGFDAGGAGDGPIGDPLGDPEGVAGGIPDGTPGGVPTAEFPGPGDLRPTIITAEVRAPKILVRVEPVYPEPARILRLRGTVSVRCIIDRKGILRNIEIQSSPHPLLADATVDAIRKWRFSPGTLRGEPVDVYFTLTTTFELR